MTTSTRYLLLLSNSTVHGSPYLEWAADYIQEFLNRKQIKKVLFIPYALHDYDKYTKTAQSAFTKWGYNIEGIHTFESPINAVQDAEAIFIGGGNTFRLLNSLYKNGIIESIRNRVLKDNIPYIGSSAGTNVSTVSINTTNDMPIVYPPSFDALKLVNFNINPHYIDQDASSKHMGESREERIKQYHEEQDTPPVLGLREGTLLKIENNKSTLLGLHPARLFVRGKEPQEFPINSDMSFLL